MRLTRVIPLAAMLAASLVGTTPASAAGAAGAVGQGTISPGLTTVPTNQTVTFTLTLGVGADSNNPTGNAIATGCVFTGASTTPETVFSGTGSGTLGNCTTGDVAGTAQYSRTGPVVTLTGTLQINGRQYDADIAVCGFQPTSVNPVRSYALGCLLTADIQ